MEIEAGDVVWLKSDEGGQKFTVGGVVSANVVAVYWYDYDSQNLKQQQINKKSLIKVPNK